MKRKLFDRLMAAVLMLSMLVSIIPTASAIDVDTGTFNPNTSQLELTFRLQLAQPVDISVTVQDSDGESNVGKLLQGVILTGYDGNLEEHGKYPEDVVSSFSQSLDITSEEEINADPMVEIGEVIVKPKQNAADVAEALSTDEETTTLRAAGVSDGVQIIENAPGEYTLIWDGSINNASVLSNERGKDTTEGHIVIQPLGYPEKNTVCTDEVDPDTNENIHTHGLNFTWTTQYVASADLYIDYRITEGDDPTFLLVKGSTSNQLLNDMVEHFKNGGKLCDFTTANPGAETLILQTNRGDPINMVDGNYHSSYTDLRMEGQIPLTFMRMYNSRYTGGSLGKGFTHSYEYKLEDISGMVRITLPYGEQLLFPRIRPDLGGGYHSMQDSGFVLSDVADGYLLTHEDGATFNFAHDGMLKAVRNPAGIEVARLTYNGDELSEIIGVSGKFMISWQNGYIASVTDSAGRTTDYTYNAGLLETVQNPDGDALTYGYDNKGYANTVRDFDGVLYIENTYDDKGRVTEQTFYNANVPTTVSMSYDDKEHTTSYTDQMGRTTVYQYDEYRNIQHISDPDGKSQNTYNNFTANSFEDNQGNRTAYTYDGQGNVSKIRDADGNETTYTYTAAGDVQSITDAEGGVQRYTYDMNRNLTKHTDARNNSTQYEYNALGLVTKRTDALNNELNYTYDAQGRLLSEVDAEGGSIAYEYDMAGRIIAIVDPLGGRTENTYSSAGKLLKSTDALGGVTAYIYNGNGFTTSITDEIGGVTSTEYGTNGQPLSVTDAVGNKTTYIYNKDGLLEKTIDAEGNATISVYDDKARLIATEDSAGNSTKYEYDTLDRLVKTVNALGGETSQTYDSMGRTKSVTDENGGTTEYFYDKLGRTAKIMDALSGTTTYEYDPNSNLLSTTDAESISTSSTYDELNRVASETDAEGQVTLYAYYRAGRVKSVTDALGGVTAYTYDLAGNVLTQTDPAGNVTGFIYDKLGRTVEQINADNSRTRTVYDAAGRTIEQYDALGGKTAFTYDANGNQLTITDPRSNVTAYTYNKNNQPLSITNADGSTENYTYNSLGQAETATDARGFSTKTVYDALGRTKTVTDSVGVINEYFYDPLGNTIKTTKDGNIISESVYDALNRVTTQKDALGNAEKYLYDKLGNIKTHTDREGNKTAYTYDKNYRVISVTNARGFLQNTEYDALGRTIKSIDANSNSTTYTYDENGNSLTITDPLNGVVTNTYDSMNRLKTSKDKLGTVTTYEYDDAGNLTKTIDGKSAVSTYEYDANGNMLTATNRNAEHTSYEYDKRNRKVKEINQINNSQEWEYDASGNLVAAVDGNKNRTVYSYDGANRKLSEKSPEGGISEYTYTHLGKTASFVAYGANGQKATTAYDYDAVGNLISETSPLGNKTTYTYDKMGNMLARTDENGVITEYEYDSVYRQTKRTDADGIATYTYDSIGNMISASDKNGAAGFEFDALNRTTKVTNENGTPTGYTYDAIGNRLSITYPDGKSVITNYDAMGRVISLIDHDGTGINYTRDAEGRVIKEKHSDGSTSEYDYNAAGLLIQQKEVDKNNSTRREIIYGYDDAGNLKSEQRSGVGVNKRYEAARYYYDKSNQLIKTTNEGRTTEYKYDLAGNLLSDGEFDYTYDLQNRLLSKIGAEDTITYEYDAVGNLLKEINRNGSVSYAYNAQNKLTRGMLPDGQSSEYTYNALGVRVKNVQIRKNKNARYSNADLKRGSGGEDYLDFLKDGRLDWQRVFESEVGTVHQNVLETVAKTYITDYLSIANRDIMVAEDGSFVQRYVYDGNSRRISAEFDYADGTHRGEAGENMASDFAVELGKVWYRTNLLDSTLFAVDADGEVVTHAIYDPWGNPQTETYTDTNLSGIDNLNNFTGYTWDETLGLYFAQNRFYDAGTHRFTQEDIVKDGTNWYAYCGNEPLGNVDWLGEYYIKMGYDKNRKGSGWYYYPVKQGMATATLITAVNQLPFDVGTELIIGLQNKNGIFGGSSFLAKSTFQEKISSFAEGVITTDAFLNELAAVSKTAATSLNVIGKIKSVFEIGADINTYGTITIRDATVFELFKLAGMNVKEPTADMVVYRMNLAYKFVSVCNDYFYASIWSGGKSLYEMHKDIYQSKGATAMERRIKKYYDDYFFKLQCSTFAKDPVTGTTKNIEILKDYSQRFKELYLDNGKRILSDVIKAFKAYVNTPLGGYNTQFIQPL